MIRRYKKSYLIINIILLALLAFLIANFFALKHTSYLFLLITLAIPTLILIAILGFEKKKRRFTYELIFYIFGYSVVFLVLTYFIGFFLGFNRNVYKLNIANLINNIIPYFFLIVVSEIFRYQIVRKGEKSVLAYILVTIILILVDLTIFRTTYDLATGDGQIKYICGIILPSLFKNIALLYFCIYGGAYPNILYRVILDLKLVVMPIFPDFGLFFDCIVDTILPAAMMFFIYLSISFYHNKEENNVNRKSKVLRNTIWIVLIISVLTTNLLVSRSFRYGIISIGSGSMAPKINKGDAVVYEKIRDYQDINVGEVLVFKKDKRTIVHRIIEIVDIDDEGRIFYTQGDANEKPDGYPILTEQVIGIAKFDIKYLGIPSVLLSEAIK